MSASSSSSHQLGVKSQDDQGSLGTIQGGSSGGTTPAIAPAHPLVMTRPRQTGGLSKEEEEEIMKEVVSFKYFFARHSQRFN